MADFQPPTWTIVGDSTDRPEAYIPLNDQRSREILAETIRRLGIEWDDRP